MDNTSVPNTEPPDIEIDNRLPHEVRQDEREARREERQDDDAPTDAAPVETSRSDALDAPPIEVGDHSDDS